MGDMEKKKPFRKMWVIVAADYRSTARRAESSGYVGKLYSVILPSSVSAFLLHQSYSIRNTTLYLLASIPHHQSRDPKTCMQRARILIKISHQSSQSPEISTFPVH